MRKHLALFFVAMLLAQEASAQLTVAYTGTFVNTELDQGGTVEMTVTFWPSDSISGYVDNDNYPGEDLLCGAGNFTGQRVGDSLFHEYPAFDPDPGCGFSWGIVTYLRSKLHNGLDSISGAYFIDPTPGVGGLGNYYLSAVQLPTALRDHPDIGFTVWPNPVQDVATVQFTDRDRIARLTVLNTIGQVILNVPLNGTARQAIDLLPYEQGVYLVEVQYADGTRAIRQLLKE